MRPGIDYPGITIVFACHDGKGNFLFSKRSANCRDEHGTWDPGGGKVDLHSTFEQTLRREIREEYCTDVLKFEAMGHREVFRECDGVKTHWIAHDYNVLIDPAKVENGEPQKADEIRWFRLDQLPSPMHSQWEKFMELHGIRLREL